MYKRYLLILVAAVIAVVLLWPDDEQPSDKKKAPPITDKREPRQARPAPWQLRQPPEEPTRQPPRSPAYPAPQGVQPAPGYSYSSGGTSPYSTPDRQPEPYEDYGYPPQYPAQQPGPYEGYGFQPQYPTQQPAPRHRTQGYGTTPQPPQYPGSGPSPVTPYGYAEPPAYRFRPLDETETSRRYRGHYPQQDYAYPGAPHPSYGPQR